MAEHDAVGDLRSGAIPFERTDVLLPSLIRRNRGRARRPHRRVEWTSRRTTAAKAVVWAHNSHLGDARATQMSDWGERNLGELTRRKYGRGAHPIGFTTHTRTVTAARDWDEPAERRQVRPSLAGSYERLFHDVEIEKLLLLLDRATLPDQFDAVIHLDVTSAITPLEPWSIPDADLPETYPVGV